MSRAPLNEKKKLILLITVVVEVLVTIFICWILYQKVLDYKRSQAAQYAAVIPKSDLIFQDKEHLKYYYELKPNITEVDDPKWLSSPATYTINGDGLNDRFDYAVEKKTGSYRIIALGDSFTFGHFVSTPQSWPEVLEDTLNASSAACGGIQFEVLNLGMRGFDIPYLVERYKSVGEKYQPDAVIWLESGSGFTRLIERQQEQIDECEKRKGSPQSEASADEMYSCWEESGKMIAERYTSDQLGEYFASYWMSFFEHVQPEKVEFFTFENIPLQQKDLLHQWMSKQPLVKVRTNLPALGEMKGLLEDGHPNASGHKVIANTIYAELLNGKLAEQCSTLHPLQPK